MRGRERGREGRGGLAPQLWSLDAPVDGDGDDDVVVEVQDLSLALVLNTSLVLCFFALSLSEFRFE